MSGAPVAALSLTMVGAAAVLIGAEPEPAGSTDQSEYALVWAQEFDEPGSPDPAVWTYEHGFARNQEAQWYQPENAVVRDGVLVIEARRERIDNPSHAEGSDDWRLARAHADYTSASLTTKNTHRWLYGRFEMRARIDTRAGLWPAWWTLGSARPWPGCGEIDIMEFYRGELLANACWQAPGGRWSQHWDSERTPIDELGGEGWADQFHLWRMDWTENSIQLFVDGRLLNSIDLDQTVNPDGSNPFREPHFMIVNLAVGGTNGGDPSATQFPARFEVDFIRVYQRQNMPDSPEGAPEGSPR